MSDGIFFDLFFFLSSLVFFDSFYLMSLDFTLFPSCQRRTAFFSHSILLWTLMANDYHQVHSFLIHHFILHSAMLA